MGLPEIVGRLLAARGVESRRRAHFLDPTLRALLPDPSVLIDMDVAADRLAHAVQHGETVGVFGDYDVDGACSAALMVTLLRAAWLRGADHVPDRMMEGYGPNGPALHRWCCAARSLIVCVDCGTAAAGAGVHRRRGRRGGAGPPQGGRPAAADRRHRQPEPAGLQLRPGLAVRRGGRLPDRGRDRAGAAPAGFFQRGRSRTCSSCSTSSRWRRCAT